MGAVNDPLEGLQGTPLCAVLPPHRESHAGHRGASVDEAEDWDALEVELAVMGGPTVHPTGVTLASGDPSNSLTVRWGLSGSRPLEAAAPGFVLVAGRGHCRVLTGGEGVGGPVGQGS